MISHVKTDHWLTSLDLQQDRKTSWCPFPCQYIIALSYSFLYQSLALSIEIYMSSVQNPSLIPWYWLVYRDSPSLDFCNSQYMKRVVFHPRTNHQTPGIAAASHMKPRRQHGKSARLGADQAQALQETSHPRPDPWRFFQAVLRWAHRKKWGNDRTCTRSQQLIAGAELGNKWILTTQQPKSNKRSSRRKYQIHQFFQHVLDQRDAGVMGGPLIAGWFLLGKITL